MKRNRNQQGVAFLDLLLAGGLIGVFSAMAMVQIQDSVQDYQLITQAEELAAELNAARTIAVSRGTVIQIRISQENNSLALYDATDPDNPVRYTKFLHGGVSFSSVPSDSITFSSRGIATTGAFTLTGDSGSVTITVDTSGMASRSPMVVHQFHEERVE